MKVGNIRNSNELCAFFEINAAGQLLAMNSSLMGDDAESLWQQLAQAHEHISTLRQRLVDVEEELDVVRVYSPMVENSQDDRHQSVNEPASPMPWGRGVEASSTPPTDDSEPKIISRVWVWGKCGHGIVPKSASEPELVVSPLGRLSRISCGKGQLAVVSDVGDVYTWGWGWHYQLGHGDLRDVSTPLAVKSLALLRAMHNKRVGDVEFGAKFSLALSCLVFVLNSN